MVTSDDSQSLMALWGNQPDASSAAWLFSHVQSRSYTHIQGEFHEPQPNSPVPHKITTARLDNCFHDSANINDKKCSGRLCVLTNEKMEDVRQQLQLPTKPLRKLASWVCISYLSAQRTINRLHLHSYHIHVAQELKDLYKAKCLHYYQWFHEFIKENGADILDNVFFSDKILFHLSS
jgi:hypothetical protein